MNMQISYLEGLEMIDMPYSDEKLIAEIEKCITKINANKIEMFFCEDNETYGSVWVTIGKWNNGCMKMKDYEVLHLHKINLEEESFKANLKECQREKRVIIKAFPNIKVTSNFR